MTYALLLLNFLLHYSKHTLLEIESTSLTQIVSKYGGTKTK